MNKLCLALLLISLVLGCNSAGEDQKAEKVKSNKTTSKETTSKLVDGEQTAASEVATLNDIAVRLSEAQRKMTDELKDKPFDEQVKIRLENTFDGYGQELLDLAEQAKDLKVRVSALKLAVRNCAGDEGAAALSSLVENGPVDLAMLRLIRERTMMFPSSDLHTWYERFESRAEEPSLKAQAIYYYIQTLEPMISLAGQELPGTSPQIRDFFASLNGAELTNKVNGLVDRLASEFMNESLGRRTVADVVKEKMYIRENLSVGKVAPDIVGSDLDGEAFKLSDYRGKVVMLDFWGDW